MRLRPVRGFLGYALCVCTCSARENAAIRHDFTGFFVEILPATANLEPWFFAVQKICFFSV
jgi:hypothetical protein